MSDQPPDSPSFVRNPDTVAGKTTNDPNETGPTHPTLIRCKFDGSNELVTAKEYYRRYYKAWGATHKEHLRERKRLANLTPRARSYRKQWLRTPAGKAYERQRNLSKRTVYRQAFGKALSNLNRLPIDQWQALLAAHDNSCAYCGKPFDLFNPPTTDHVIPLSLGGQHSPKNIVPACLICNGRKGKHVWKPRPSRRAL